MQLVNLLGAQPLALNETPAAKHVEPLKLPKPEILDYSILLSIMELVSQVQATENW